MFFLLKRTMTNRATFDVVGKSLCSCPCSVNSLILLDIFLFIIHLGLSFLPIFFSIFVLFSYYYVKKRKKKNLSSHFTFPPQSSRLSYSDTLFLTCPSYLSHLSSTPALSHLSVSLSHAEERHWWRVHHNPCPNIVSTLFACLFRSYFLAIKQAFTKSTKMGF